MLNMGPACVPLASPARPWLPHHVQVLEAEYAGGLGAHEIAAAAAASGSVAAAAAGRGC